MSRSDNVMTFVCIAELERRFSLNALTCATKYSRVCPSSVGTHASRLSGLWQRRQSSAFFSPAFASAKVLAGASIAKKSAADIAAMYLRLSKFLRGITILSRDTLLPRQQRHTQSSAWRMRDCRRAHG